MGDCPHTERLPRVARATGQQIKSSEVKKEKPWTKAAKCHTRLCRSGQPSSVRRIPNSVRSNMSCRFPTWTSSRYRRQDQAWSALRGSGSDHGDHDDSCTVRIDRRGGREPACAQRCLGAASGHRPRRGALADCPIRSAVRTGTLEGTRVGDVTPRPANCGPAGYLGGPDPEFGQGWPDNGGAREEEAPNAGTLRQTGCSMQTIELSVTPPASASST